MEFIHGHVLLMPLPAWRLQVAGHPLGAETLPAAFSALGQGQPGSALSEGFRSPGLNDQCQEEPERWLPTEQVHESAHGPLPEPGDRGKPQCHGVPEPPVSHSLAGQFLLTTAP